MPASPPSTSNATWRRSSAGPSSRPTWTSDTLRCELADSLVRIHPKWQGYAVRHKIEIKFAYISPADGGTHASSMTMSEYPKGQPLRAGEVLRVLASKTKADKTRTP